MTNKAVVDPGGAEAHRVDGAAILAAVAVAAERLLGSPLEDCASDVLRLIGVAAGAQTATIWNYRDHDSDIHQMAQYRWVAPGHDDVALQFSDHAALEQLIGNRMDEVRRGEAINIRLDEWTKTPIGAAGQWSIRRVVSVPIFVADRVWGDFSLAYSSDADPSSDSVDSVRSAASCIAGAIELDETRRQLARRDAVLTAVADIAKALTKATSVAVGASAALEALGRATGAIVVVLYEFIEREGTVRMHAVHRWSSGALPPDSPFEGVRICGGTLYDHLLAGETVSREIVHWTEAQQAAAATMGVVDAVMLPVFIGEHQLWGGMRLGFTDSQARSAGEMDAMRAGADIFGNVIHAERTAVALAASEERLRQAQKIEAIGRLAGGVAHDFNNLLTAILGYADILHTETGSEEAVHIVNAARRAASLTGQLLAFSRQGALRQEVVDLASVVNEAATLLERIIGEDIVIISTIAPGCGDVLGDAGQMHQVVMNLALNARDAMPTGGSVRIGLRNVEISRPEDGPVAPGRYVRLTVEDEGVGMDPSTLERAVEPFFTTKGVGQGTGLGLSTVYGIVRSVGGEIIVSSSPGKGTNVDVYLPWIVNVEDTPQQPVPPPAGPSSGAVVLLVEDEEIVRTFAFRALEREGLRVLVASHPNDALQLARAEPSIDLLVSDVVMPGMNGHDLAVQFSQLHPNAGILLMSGYPGNHVLPIGTTEIDFLAKPFGADTLVQAVRANLARAR